ncbi:ABC transporter permease [Phenylobacterium sp.]|jgi:putative ABC transport system permease protein|uniref:ABC transporter permease n=1 Tax=Phenylobacterium sp. TaxID=1871053 RepID=UPI0037CA3615
MSLMSQTRSVIAMNVRSIPQRLWMSVATVVSIALVVAVLLGFLSLANGFNQTLKGSGAPDVAIVLREGSEAELNSTLSREQVDLLARGPGVKIGADGRPIVSGELFLVVDGIKKSSRTKANMPLRGVGANGLLVRKQAKISQGRMFAPGSNEIVVGAGLLREFEGFELGKLVRFGAQTWRVVGVFEAPGTVFESELWADAPVVQSLFKRGTSFQTARVVLTSPGALPAFEAYAKSEPRLQLKAQSELAYYAAQAERSGLLIRYFGWPLGIIMAIGALAGALNTMYASVSSRAAEIATLRVIGFSGFSAFMGTMVEAMVLSAIGALLGVAICALGFNGLSASTLGAGFTQVAFRVQIGPEIIGQAVTLALIIGLVGGIFPGWRAARQKPLLALAA